MKARPKLKSRSSTLANNFVQAIIPRLIDAKHQLELYAKCGIKVGECAYCGAAASDGDHFRSIVRSGRPSGHFHTADNIVPSCSRCNNSKSGSHWKSWMFGPARNSPKTRKIHDIDTRAERLEKFENLSSARAAPVEKLREIAGAEIWDEYWARLDRMIADLEAAERNATIICERLDAAFHAGKI